MKRLFITFVFSAGLISCDRTETKTSDDVVQAEFVSIVPTISLARQLYFYAPELDTVTCEATGACDCCSGQILFLNDSEFVSIDYCESDADYCKGKYHLANNNLVLTTDSICISRRYNWEKETDTSGNVLFDYFVTDTLIAKTTQTFKRITCKGTICFLMGEQEKYFVTPSHEQSLSKAVATLKKQGIWDRLQIKNYH